MTTFFPVLLANLNFGCLTYSAIGFPRNKFLKIISANFVGPSKKAVLTFSGQELDGGGARCPLC
jgi:hypothetical protein